MVKVDRIMHKDIEKVVEIMKSESLVKAAEKEIGQIL
jgi:hypothetical protein